MNHSLTTADRQTHLKIVILSLVAAIAVVVVGITARLNTSAGPENARMQAEGPVMKAGKPVAVTVRDVTVR